MSVTFTCYNDTKANGIVYLCDEHPEVFGLHEGLAHHWMDMSALCKHLARKECGLEGPLSGSSTSEHDEATGVEVHTITITEINR